MIALNTRSHYSFMWGTASVNALCKKAKEFGYAGLALTDTDNLCGMWQFISACRRHGLRPFIGAELTDPVTAHRAVCLVKTPEGYRHLTRLITRRHTDNKFCLKTALPSLNKGLLILTKNHDLLSFWKENQVDLAVNLPRNPLSRHHPLYVTAEALNIPLAATPGSFFLNPQDAAVHRMLRAIENNTSLSRLTLKDAAPQTAFLASPEYYHQKFGIQPETIKNTFALSEKLEFTGPSFGIVMPPLKDTSGIPADQLLYKKTIAGAKKRYGRSLSGKILARIDHEMTIIRKKNFCEYFLVVQNIVKRASRICGRGSGAASIVAYCLGITNVCPVKYNLYFERFLNPDRTDPPDIDVDFAWDERDDILSWVLAEFKGHSAMVSSHILFQPRMAVREVAKVFGLPEAEISKVSKRLPWFWKQNEAEDDLLSRIRVRPEFRFMDFPQPWPQIMAYAQALVGIPRYLSVHPGGIVITPEPIDSYVPVQKAPKGVPLIQWEKESTETAGLVKIDLLGNRSLGVIRDCIHSIKTATGSFNDFNRLDPEDDYDTQQTVAQGNTMGCFYIESPATRLLQKKSKIGDFEHVVIHSSIIRPAANEFIQEYLLRLHTGVWEPLHPLLKDILNDTYGIMVYQEDVSKVAVKIAGFSHAKADGLRKIMSKKNKAAELSDYYEQFRKGALANKVSLDDIQRIWNMIRSFSGYSFCKPHSASYARVSFQAAYLKTHYPAQFMAAVITNQGGFYSTFAYVSEARRLDITILAPDVTHSDIHWIGNSTSLRPGLSAVRDLSHKTMGTIIKERCRTPFSNFEDFLIRVRPSKDEIHALIYSQSLDTLCPNTSHAELLWRFSAWQEQIKQSQSPGLFNIPDTEVSLPIFPEDKPKDLLRQEFSTLGFICTRHPITLYKNIIQHHHIIKACHISRFTGRKITVAGWLITGKTVKTKQGDPMKFLTFEDDTGIVETVFFPKAYAQFCHMLDYGRPYLLSGIVDENWGAVTLTVEHTRPIQP